MQLKPNLVAVTPLLAAVDIDQLVLEVLVTAVLIILMDCTSPMEDSACNA